MKQIQTAEIVVIIVTKLHVCIKTRIQKKLLFLSNPKNLMNDDVLNNKIINLNWSVSSVVKRTLSVR